MVNAKGRPMGALCVFIRIKKKQEVLTILIIPIIERHQ